MAVALTSASTRWHSYWRYNMSNKLWEFTGETKVCFGTRLKRIRATVEFKLKCGIVISKGELGGLIEKESNLCGDAWVCCDACVYGDARVCGDARVHGNARVESSKDYCVYKNTWSSFRWFTYTRSNKMWSVGCFYGTGAELIAKAYEDSEKSGRCYEAVVKAQEAIEKAMEV